MRRVKFGDNVDVSPAKLPSQEEDELDVHRIQKQLRAQRKLIAKQADQISTLNGMIMERSSIVANAASPTLASPAPPQTPQTSFINTPTAQPAAVASQQTAPPSASKRGGSSSAGSSSGAAGGVARAPSPRGTGVQAAVAGQLATQRVAAAIAAAKAGPQSAGEAGGSSERAVTSREHGTSSSAELERPPSRTTASREQSSR